MLTVLFVILSLLISLEHPISAQEISNEDMFLKSIPDRDKRYLERFFQVFFLEEDFSYTLFGDKPMSFSGLSHQNMPHEIYVPRSSRHLPIGQSFEIFKKLRNKFPNDEHIFVLNEDKDGIFIYFINTKAFLQVIEANIDVFLKELGENFTASAFLQELQEEKRPVLEIIHHHEGILGILLGYGRHNSLLFQRKADILGRCWAYEHNEHQANDLSKDIEEELHYLDSRLGSFSNENDYNSLIPIPPLGFAADKEHPETKNLAKKYRSIREKINIAYSQEPPFEVIMRMLVNSKSNTAVQKRCSELPIAPAKSGKIQ